jgi:ribonucleotide monophosphatase NagD (HAD superfamily)
MHDGTNTYEGVLDAISKLKEANKELIILSNSSKRQDNSIKMLKKLGFDPNDFAEIITSGEVSYHMLAKTTPEESSLAPQPWARLESSEKRIFCFGSGAGDEDYLTSAGWTLSDIENADVIVARGTFTILDGETVIHKTHDGEDAYFEAYHKNMAKAAERKIPMIVANPDKIRPDADRSPMPGTIGTAYEKALGGDGKSSNGGSGLIKYMGKPFADVYEISLRNRDRTRACMIGDALETDIAGGTFEGIDTIWVVKDGIHIDDIQSRGFDTLEEGCDTILDDFNKLEDTYAEGRQLSPTIILPHFRW